MVGVESGVTVFGLIHGESDRGIAHSSMKGVGGEMESVVYRLPCHSSIVTVLTALMGV